MLTKKNFHIKNNNQSFRDTEYKFNQNTVIIAFLTSRLGRNTIQNLVSGIAAVQVANLPLLQLDGTSL